MSLLGILLSSFFIGFSGAVMPGPLLGITIDASLKKGFIAGPLIIIGNGILEFSLIILMTLGLKDFLANNLIAGFIGITGGIYLGWMGYSMVKASIQKTLSLQNSTADNVNPRSLVLSGIIISATNPYFILWWATTGIEMLRQSYTFGLIGVLLFFFGHIMSDLTWYTAISTTFSKGKSLLTNKTYQHIIFVLGLFLLAFSLYFIKNGLVLVTKSMESV